MITAWPEPNTDAASGATTPTDDLQSAASSRCDAASRRPVQISTAISKFSRTCCRALLACRPRIGARTAVRHRRPLQVLQAHCLRARRQHDLLVPPVGVHPYERVAPQLLPRGRCPCRRRGAPNRGAATAPSCPRRSRPMAPPPWRSGTLPRSVWSARGMAVEVRTARCRRWRRRPEQGRTVFDLPSRGCGR